MFPGRHGVSDDLEVGAAGDQRPGDACLAVARRVEQGTAGFCRVAVGIDTGGEEELGNRLHRRRPGEPVERGQGHVVDGGRRGPSVRGSCEHGVCQRGRPLERAAHCFDVAGVDQRS